MNCRHGDLAIVVRGHPQENVGKVIRCVALDSFSSVVCSAPMWTYEGNLVGLLGTRSVAVADSCLRPIRHPGDDAVDEMVRGVSCERTRTGEVTS